MAARTRSMNAQIRNFLVCLLNPHGTKSPRQGYAMPREDLRLPTPRCAPYSGRVQSRSSDSSVEKFRIGRAKENRECCGRTAGAGFISGIENNNISSHFAPVNHMQYQGDTGVAVLCTWCRSHNATTRTTCKWSVGTTI